MSDHHDDARSFFFANDLSGAAMFRYFETLSRGQTRAAAEQAALELEAELARRGAIRHLDVYANEGCLGALAALVATWLDARPDVGTCIVLDDCVGVEVRELEAAALGAELRRMARAAGHAALIARIDARGPRAEAAFTTRRRPTVILSAVAA